MPTGRSGPIGALHAGRSRLGNGQPAARPPGTPRCPSAGSRAAREGVRDDAQRSAGAPGSGPTVPRTAERRDRGPVLHRSALRDGPLGPRPPETEPDSVAVVVSVIADTEPPVGALSVVVSVVGVVGVVGVVAAGSVTSSGAGLSAGV